MMPCAPSPEVALLLENRPPLAAPYTADDATLADVFREQPPDPLPGPTLASHRLCVLPRTDVLAAEPVPPATAPLLALPPFVATADADVLKLVPLPPSPLGPAAPPPPEEPVPVPLREPPSPPLYFVVPVPDAAAPPAPPAAVESARPRVPPFAPQLDPAKVAPLNQLSPPVVPLTSVLLDTPTPPVPMRYVAVVVPGTANEKPVTPLYAPPPPPDACREPLPPEAPPPMTCTALLMLSQSTGDVYTWLEPVGAVSVTTVSKW